MATSGSVDYTLNRNEVIRSAYEIVGVAIDGEALNADDINVAARALNVMLKAWIPKGLKLWKRDSISITLTASQSAYTLGRSGSPDVTVDRPLRVLEANRLDSSSNATPINKLSLEEYENLPNKTTEGTPISYYFNPSLDNATINFWLTPDTSAASNFAIDLVVSSPLEDMDNQTDNFDFPAEWLESIIYGLAVRLIPRNGGLTTSEVKFIKDFADDAFDSVSGWDEEDGSVYFSPETRGH